MQTADADLCPYSDTAGVRNLSSFCRFDVLQGSQCFTCTVGTKISKAQYYMEDTDAVVNMMQVRKRFHSSRIQHVILTFVLLR